MANKSKDLVHLVSEILMGAKLDDQARFKQMVEETKAGLESGAREGAMHGSERRRSGSWGHGGAAGRGRSRRLNHPSFLPSSWVGNPMHTWRATTAVVRACPSAGIVSAGHSFAMKRLSAQQGLAGWMSEQVGRGGGAASSRGRAARPVACALGCACVRCAAGVRPAARRPTPPLPRVLEGTHVPATRLLRTSAGVPPSPFGLSSRHCRVRAATRAHPPDCPPARTQMGGLTYLEFMRTLSKRVDSDWDSVKADLHAIRAALLSRWAPAGGTGGAAARAAAARRMALGRQPARSDTAGVRALSSCTCAPDRAACVHALCGPATDRIASLRFTHA